jgi:hypothetical protein
MPDGVVLENTFYIYWFIPPMKMYAKYLALIPENKTA